MKRLLLIFCLFFHISFACTTMIITKGATEDGSMVVTHSDDDEFGDQRIIYVSAKRYPKNQKRAIYLEKATFPRYVGKDRSMAYQIPGFEKSKPVGFIDQVEKTYAYFDGNYGIINEYQLAIGECTNSTNFYFESPSKDRIFGIGELSRIALERCKKAKDAVLLMGELAEKHGYYGWGETLLLADKDEGWVFEICCAPSGKGALWVAKKVPDGEIFVAANQFRIQEIKKDDPDILFSSKLFEVAKEQNKYDEKKPLNWLHLVCPGEFDHPYYSLRRVWRMFDRINPSLHLSPWVEDAWTSYYPFSIKPEKKLSLKDIFHLYRDHYEGTEFDLTKGLASGPYGSPTRNIGSYDRTDFPNKRTKPLTGAWERAISMYYTGYTYVTQLRNGMSDAIGGCVWIGFNEPYTNCFMPLYAGMETLPHSFQYGSSYNFSKTFAFWPFNFVSNWIQAQYSLAKEDVIKKQTILEEQELDRQKEFEKQMLSLLKEDPNKAKKRITQYCIENASYILHEWDSLGKYLIEKYNDGYLNKPDLGQMIGYPKWWLDSVGYDKGPISYQRRKVSEAVAENE